MNSPNRAQVSPITWVLLSFLLVLSVLALVLWKQRVIMLDASFQVFSVIASEKYAFMFERYGAVLCQTLPLLLTKAGASLSSVLVSYSLAFTLYPILLFVLLLWLRQVRFAWLIGLYFCMLMSHTFFWIQSEFIQATVLCLFIMGLVGKAYKGSCMVLLLVPMALLLLAIYTHPLAIAVLSFGFAYLLVDAFAKKQRAGFKYIGFLLLSMALFYGKNIYFQAASYDQEAMGMLSRIPEAVFDIYALLELHDIQAKFLSIYFPFTFSFLLTVLFLLYYRKWLKALMVLVAVPAWLVIVVGIWPEGADDFHFESFLLLLGIFVAFPLAFDLLPRWPVRYAGAFLVVLAVLKLIGIFQVKPIYTQRLAYVQEITRFVQAKEKQRFVVDAHTLDDDKILQSWGLPYETLLLSATEQPDAPRTILTYYGTVPSFVAEHQSNAIFTHWGPFFYGWMMNNDHFRFTDTRAIEDISEELKGE